MKQMVSIAVSLAAILATGSALAQKLGTSGAVGSNATLQAAEYILVAPVICSDAKSRKSGGAVGALGGTYASSDMGKITALALLDGFRKLTVDAQAAIPAR